MPGILKTRCDRRAQLYEARNLSRSSSGSTMDATGAVEKDPAKRKKLENQLRTFKAAAVRHDRSLDDRMKSAHRASNVNYKLHGKHLVITKEGVQNGNLYTQDLGEISPRRQLNDQLSATYKRRSDILDNEIASMLHPTVPVPNASIPVANAGNPLHTPNTPVLGYQPAPIPNVDLPLVNGTNQPGDSPGYSSEEPIHTDAVETLVEPPVEEQGMELTNHIFDEDDQYFWFYFYNNC